MLFLLLSLAMADDFDDRITLKDRQAQATFEATVRENARFHNAEDLRRVQAFVDANGGATRGTCDVATKPVFTAGRQVHTTGTARLPWRQTRASREYSIISCRVRLVNDLVCELKPDRIYGYFKVAVCADRGGNSSPQELPGDPGGLAER